MKALETRLKECGIDLALYRTAVSFFEKRGFTLGYGGRGKYGGMFHLSTCKGGGQWVCKLAEDITTITDAPSGTMKELKAI